MAFLESHTPKIKETRAPIEIPGIKLIKRKNYSISQLFL